MGVGGLLGVNISRELEVFERVEGYVSIVHHSYDHWDISTLIGQQLDGSQVGHGIMETGTQQRGSHIKGVSLMRSQQSEQ